MKWIGKLKDKLQTNISFNCSIKIVIILLIVYLLILTSNFWFSVFTIVSKIALPFVIGFIVAYLLHPLIHKFEKIGVSRKIVIPVLFIFILIMLSLLLFAISPVVYNRIIDFINSIGQGVNSLFEIYKSLSENDPSPIVQTMVQQFNELLSSSKTLLPNFSVLIPKVFNGLISFLTNTLLAIIVSFYFLFDYERVTAYIDSISGVINIDLPKIYNLVDKQIGAYLHGLLILMIIKFIEYSVLYSLVGHKDWVIIAMLTSVGLLIPYFGATVANLVGILTALTLPTSNIFFLIIGVLILSNFDAYIIGPIVHLKNSQVEPLWTLFSIITGGILFGSVGVMISIPAFMICRVLINFYREKSNSEVNGSL